MCVFILHLRDEVKRVVVTWVDEFVARLSGPRRRGVGHGGGDALDRVEVLRGRVRSRRNKEDVGRTVEEE